MSNLTTHGGGGRSQPDVCTWRKVFYNMMLCSGILFGLVLILTKTENLTSENRKSRIGPNGEKITDSWDWLGNKTIFTERTDGTKSLETFQGETFPTHLIYWDANGNISAELIEGDGYQLQQIR